jgi:hypothetical protein
MRGGGQTESAVCVMEDPSLHSLLRPYMADREDDSLIFVTINIRGQSTRGNPPACELSTKLFLLQKLNRKNTNINNKSNALHLLSLRVRKLVFNLRYENILGMSRSVYWGLYLDLRDRKKLTMKKVAT